MNRSMYLIKTPISIYRYTSRDSCTFGSSTIMKEEDISPISYNSTRGDARARIGARSAYYRIFCFVPKCRRDTSGSSKRFSGWSWSTVPDPVYLRHSKYCFYNHGYDDQEDARCCLGHNLKALFLGRACSWNRFGTHSPELVRAYSHWSVLCSDSLFFSCMFTIDDIFKATCWRGLWGVICQIRPSVLNFGNRTPGVHTSGDGPLH